MSTTPSALPLGGTAPRSSGRWLKNMPEYIRRAINYPQMDVDYTVWQMVYLCLAPAKVYRTTKYHRQTKNQWARDDPAFVAIIVLLMAISSLAYAIAFHRNFFGFLKAVFFSVVIDFLLAGVVLSTIMWWVANTYLRIDSTGTHATEQYVEWMYSFDVHCNSYFPFFMIVNVGQYFLLPLFLRKGMLWAIFANLLYCCAGAYYTFVTFLGYDILPFLQHTTVFLYPIPACGFFFIITTAMRINICRAVMAFYFT
ncbi:hypothetical protein NDN08_007023 [Rhodosorus marinus]|uniref:UNC-50 family protein n=1 Tax=Rhodosorus marinus TaxID=101924 RepID=A0AAV8UFC3_9RHOD|nr:hypothetical protein NDN08_007023 [Rhodosorus marinus]